MIANVTSNQTILGFNTGHHGGCAIINGNRIFAIAEERLNRRKYSEGYMYSLLYCLDSTGLSVNDIDLFVSSSYGNRLPMNFMGDFKKMVNNISDTAHFITVDHHLSHAYSSYFLSNFDEALIIVIDGQGNENDTESYYVARGNVVTRVGGNNPARSRYQGIGRTYETFTNFCGWSAQEAGKTMGLAPYGVDKYPDLRLYDIDDDFRVSSRCYGKYLDASVSFCESNNIDFGLPEMGFENRDAAFFVQDRTEKVILQLINSLCKKYGIYNVCLAGGVFLNSVINGKIFSETVAKKIFVAPCCDDTGEALGNLLYGYHHFYKNEERVHLKNPYLGRSYSEAELLDVLGKKQSMFILPYSVKGCNYTYYKSDNITAEAAKLLSQGKILGWFQDGSEIGPRALGNRSILCAPFPASMKEILNSTIKHRESFRPFAPSILEEMAGDYFNLSTHSPYMLQVATVKSSMIDKIPAVTHVDGTARIQTVNKECNERFYNLIRSFYDISGVPVLLNTSFNDNGEPIVESPKDAMVMFCRSKLDYLIMGDYVVYKERKP